MSRLIATANNSGVGLWLKDLAALASIGAFVWVAGTWVHIAQALALS